MQSLMWLFCSEESTLPCWNNSTVLEDMALAALPTQTKTRVSTSENSEDGGYIHKVEVTSC